MAKQYRVGLVPVRMKDFSINILSLDKVKLFSPCTIETES